MEDYIICSFFYSNNNINILHLIVSNKMCWNNPEGIF